MSDTKQAVQQQFGQVAANYRTSAVHASGLDLQTMLNAVPLTGAERVLDAGCGAGHTAVTFAPQVASVVALDLTATMLDQTRLLAAERGLRNLTLQRGDVEALPFAPASFDLVTSRYSAHHYPEPHTALREFRRVLAPGGHLILSDVIAPAAPALDTFLQTVELLRDPSHVRDHSAAQWLMMLQETGFTAQVVGMVAVPLNFEAWVKRINTPAPYVETLKSLWHDANDAVRSAFHVEPDYSFTLTCGVFLATRGVEGEGGVA